MPFDIGRFLETGGKFAYEILSEQKSHEKKLDEIEAKLKADKEQTQATLDAGIKEGRVKGLYDFMKSDASGESKVKMWEMHSSEGLVPSLYQIQNMAATQAGQMMPGGTAGATAPGGVAGVGGLYDGTQYTPPETGGMPKMFEPQPEEPKKYPQTRKEVEAHEVFKGKLKPKPLGKTPAERELDRAISFVTKIASYEKMNEEKLKKLGLWKQYVRAQQTIREKGDVKAFQRYATDVDAYYDKMLDLYKGLGEEKAKMMALKETRKFLNLMGIDEKKIAPYMRQDR